MIALWVILSHVVPPFDSFLRFLTNLPWIWRHSPPQCVIQQDSYSPTNKEGRLHSFVSPQNYLPCARPWEPLYCTPWLFWMPTPGGLFYFRSLIWWVVQQHWPYVIPNKKNCYAYILKLIKGWIVLLVSMRNNRICRSKITFWIILIYIDISCSPII